MWTLPFGFFASGLRPADIILIDTNFMHTNVSLTRTSTAWYLNSSQILTQAAGHAARYEYDVNGNYRGLMVEGSTTNRVRSAATLVNYSVKIGITTATFSIASYFANSMQFPASPATMCYAAMSATGASGTNIYSVFVRMDDNSAPVVGTSSSTGDFAISFSASGTTPTISTTPATVEYYGGSVYRVSVSGTHSAINYGIAQYPTQSGKGFRIVGHNLDDTAQVNVVSSYILTSGSGTMRVLDTISTTLATIGISAVAGTLFIEHTAASGAALFSSGANAILSSQGAGKIAIAYDATGTRICYNGGTVTTGSALTFSTVLRIAMGTTGLATTCHIKKCTWHNTKLSASDLQTLTT